MASGKSKRSAPTHGIYKAEKHKEKNKEKRAEKHLSLIEKQKNNHIKLMKQAEEACFKLKVNNINQLRKKIGTLSTARLRDIQNDIWEITVWWQKRLKKFDKKSNKIHKND